MTYRGITEVIFLDSCGFVYCIDTAGRQTPQLQGMFSEVLEQIREHLELNKEEIKWKHLGTEGQFNLSFEEWVEYGKNFKIEQLKVKPLPL